MCEKYYHTQAGLWRWSLYIDVPWEEYRKQPHHVGVCFSWFGGEKGHEDELELVLLRVGELQYLCILGRSTGGMLEQDLDLPIALIPLCRVFWKPNHPV